MPALDEIGDFAFGGEIARQYAFAAQVQLGLLDRHADTDLHADCLTGLYAAAEFDLTIPDQQLVLSPGDLDEIIIAFLAFGGDADASAFQRTVAFRTGFLDGFDACRSLPRLTEPARKPARSSRWPGPCGSRATISRPITPTPPMIRTNTARLQRRRPDRPASVGCVPLLGRGIMCGDSAPRSVGGSSGVVVRDVPAPAGAAADRPRTPIAASVTTRMARTERRTHGSIVVRPPGQRRIGVAPGSGRDTGRSSTTGPWALLGRPVSDRTDHLASLGASASPLTTFLKPAPTDTFGTFLAGTGTGGAGLGVAGGGLLAGHALELQEAGPGDGLLARLGHRLHDLLEAVQHGTGRLLVDTGLLRDLLDELALVHQSSSRGVRVGSAV